MVAITTITPILLVLEDLNASRTRSWLERFGRPPYWRDRGVHLLLTGTQVADFQNVAP